MNHQARYLHQTMVLFGLLIGMSTSIIAQESIHLSDKDFYFPNSADYQNNDLPAIALQHLDVYAYTNDHIDATAQNSHQLSERRSIDLMLESVHRQGADAQIHPTYLAIANKYFDISDYDQANRYYHKIDPDKIDSKLRQELYFKWAYTDLIDKDFMSADARFAQALESHGTYNDDCYYYSGICEYFMMQKEESIASFKKVDNHPKYQDIIPYYLSQIYFQDEDYRSVIEYAEKKLRSPHTKNKNQINRILGLSYLALEDYRKALPYLESYAQDTPKLTENEFYQIAIINYNLNQYDKAEEYFKELSHEASPIGQMSNYLLGSIYLDKLQKKDAQSAFKQASKTAHDVAIQEESQFLYYKLSADLTEERIAINGLSSIEKSSPYFTESQGILSDILEQTSDYEAALQIIEGLAYKNSKINETYKSISYKNGLKYMKDEKLDLAINNFQKSLETEGNSAITAKTNFWKGYAHDIKGQPSAADKHLQEYVNSNDREFLFEANYVLAYNQLDKKDYKSSLSNLESAIESFSIGDDNKYLFDDALVRLADLQLLNNNYSEALSYYDLAIENDAVESDYILYQKSMIQGVNNKHVDKLTNLELLIKKYPQSEYRDDAIFQIGESLVELGKHNEAFQLYNRVIIEYADNSSYTPTAHMRQGLLSYNSGDMYTALDAYKLGLKKSNNKEERRQALIAIEEIYLKELNDPEAFFSYTENEGGVKISDISKDSITYTIAYESYKSAHYEKAIQQFEKYSTKYPNGHYIENAHFQIADSYVLLKKYDAALPHYEKLLQKENGPFYTNALKNAALISYNHKQDFVNSYKYYNKLIESMEVAPMEYMEAALYSAFISKNDKGIEEYGRQIIIHPEANKDSKSAANFYLAKSYTRQNKTIESIPYYKQVTELSTNNQSAEASYTLSKIYYDNKQYTEAEVQAFETTKNAAPYPFWVAKSLILIGDIYQNKDDNINASAAYESVIENFKENNEIIQEATEKLDALNEKIEENSRVIEEEPQTEQMDFIHPESLN